MSHSTLINFTLADYVEDSRSKHAAIFAYAKEVRRTLEVDGHLTEFVEFGLSDMKLSVGVFRPKTRSIGLSRLYVEHASIESIENTILHEFAHACDYFDRGRSDHGTQWRRWCERLGMRHIERCADADEAGDMPMGRYKANCSDCHAEGLAYRWKMSKTMRENRWLCKHCRGRIVWVDMKVAS